MIKVLRRAFNAGVYAAISWETTERGLDKPDWHPATRFIDRKFKDWLKDTQ